MLVDMLALCTMLNWTEYDVVHAPGQTGKHFHVTTYTVSNTQLQS